MKRREFITLLGGAAAAWPLAARAQQGERVRRIGVLMNLAEDDAEGRNRISAFLQALQQLGWTDGHNARIDTRWGVGDLDLYRRYAVELVALAPDVILTSGGSAVSALQRATRTVPIVFVTVTDPVGGGLVEGLARPGGNTTGFTQFEYGMSAKWLELLKQVAPGVTRVGVLRASAFPTAIGQFAAIQAVASSFGVELRPIDARDAGEIESAVTAFAHGANGGLIVTSNPLMTLISNRSSRWQHGFGYPPFIPPATSSRGAALPPTAQAPSTSSGVRPVMSVASSGVRSRPTYRCRCQPSTKRCSTSRPPRRSASPLPRACSPSPTR
jgi:putative ABC transport system substrate-binding protein